MKKKFIKTPLKGVYVHGAKDVGTRTVNLLMGEHAGEYVRGDIMDANAVIQAFDDLKGNVDNNHDSLEEIVDELHNLRDATDQSFEVFQEKAEEETANRIQGDKTLDEKIDQKEKESKERDNTLQQNIDTEKQERINADTQLRNDLTAEVNRAKASENALSENIKAEATKRENDDNTIKDSLNAEVTRATAKENEIKAEVDIINGDSTTEGSFRKAIADVVGAAPEAYDTLKEIADKLNENDDLHAAINDAIATKATTVALNEEIARAKAAEAENKAEIAAETARAKEVEGNNALAIQNEQSRATLAETTIQESLNTEIDRAKGQEAYLQNLVNTKADTTALEGAKTELDKKISDETTRATAEEDELRSLITTEQNRATASEKSIADDLNGKLAKKADTTTLNEQIDTLNAAISAKADTTALTILEQKVTANTTAITNVTISKGIPYDPSVTAAYQTDKNFFIKLNDANTAFFGPSVFMGIKSGDYTFSVNPGGIKQVGSYIFDVNNGDGVKFSSLDGVSYSQMNMYGFDAKIGDEQYTKCGHMTGLDIKGGGPYSGTQTTLNPDKLLMKRSDDRQVMLNPDQLLIKSGDTKLSYATNVLSVEYGDRHVELGPFANEASGGICIHEGLNGNLYIYPDQIIISGGGRSGITINGDEITTNNGSISFVGHLIQGCDIIIPNLNGAKLSEIIKDIWASKQDKITPTTELDLTSIDTADIESLRSIVKALATELNTLGLIKLKSAE